MSTPEIHVSRYLDAPPDLVYRAFTDPDQVARWMGPLAYHVPRDGVEVEATVGGPWRMTMVSNDDHDATSPIDSTFVEVVPDQLLVAHETARGFPGVEDGTTITMSIELTPEGEGTRLDLRQGPFPEPMGEMAGIGWGQALHKLAGLLATPPQFRAGG